MSPNTVPPDNNEWVSTSVAAARLGVSERTVQRRASKGSLPAREVTDEQGKRWQIRRDALPTPDDTFPPSADAPDRVTTGDDTLTSGTANISPVPDAKVPPPADSTHDARYIAAIERENAFLRAQVEEGNRNAAELRAALRKALDMAPRQLTASSAPESAQAPVDVPPQVPTPAATLRAHSMHGMAPDDKAARTGRGHALAQIREGLRGLFKK